MDGKLRNMTSIYITKGDEILLLYRQGGKVVNEVWTGSAGGHFEDFECNDARACVLRELQEELNVSEEILEDLRLRYITLRSINGEIRQNYFFFAQLREGIEINFYSNEGTLKWFAKSEVLNLDMPYSAKFVVKHYLETGHTNDMLYVGVANGEDVVFTKLPEA